QPLHMPFRSSFDCLWCGTAWTVRAPSDIEGWAQLCPDCVGKAGDNEFLRFRLRQALTERGGGPSTATVPGSEGPAPAGVATAAPGDEAADLVAYYEARAAEYDD